MQKITYAGESFLTADSVATALLDFAAALAGAISAEPVEVPVVAEDGTPGRVQIVLGPASQIVTRPVETGMTEPPSEDFVQELERRCWRVRGARPVPFREEDDPSRGLLDDPLGL